MFGARCTVVPKMYTHLVPTGVIVYTAHTVACHCSQGYVTFSFYLKAKLFSYCIALGGLALGIDV